MIEHAGNGAHKLGEAKEIKVKIPLDFHIKLHTLKVLKGQSISDTVEMALERYFTEYGDGQAPPRAPTAQPAGAAPATPAATARPAVQ